MASVLVLLPTSHVVKIYLFLVLNVIYPLDHGFTISGETTIFEVAVI